MSTKIELTFGKPRVFLPVIHAATVQQVLRNIGVAVEAGADGVFLINGHTTKDINDEVLLYLVDSLREVFPDLWIGINCLSLSPLETAQRVVVRTFNGFWSDNAGIVDQDVSSEATQTADLITKFGCIWKGLYFGGVAFKYQTQPKSFAATARTAQRYLDVLTTTGDATGAPPTVDKIRTMRRAVDPDTSIAIASGITAANVEQFLPYADAYLVNTGISYNWTALNPDACKELADKIHAYTPAI